MNKIPSIKPASDRSIIIEFGDNISEQAHSHIVYFSDILLGSHSNDIKNISPAYNSILVRLKDGITISHMLKSIKNIFKDKIKIKDPPANTIKIPVCYESEYAPDIERVMKYTGFSKDTIIKKHVSAQYLVYFLGFSPGFPYIGGMDKSLETPRLKSPRTKVPAGSVAIGGKQTGIYPMQSPGGWNIIGRTHLNLFEWSDIENMPIKMGCKIEFYSISKDELLNAENS